MARLHRPPLETVASGRAHPLAAVKKAVLACALVAGLFGGEALLSWAESLPVHPISDRVVAAAAFWRDATFDFGLSQPAERLRAEFRRLQEVR
jgi:hypothetical protein